MREVSFRLGWSETEGCWMRHTLSAYPSIAMNYERVLDKQPVLCYHCRDNNQRYRGCVMKVGVGMEAPDFELVSHMDDKVRLSEYRGRHNVLIAFFPMAWTPV